tara:strand:- start:501 stop:728 length:228 start_codon:yes stop_codon:yes gene_type:complete
MLEHLGLPFGYQYSKQTGGNTTGKVTYDEFDSIMDVKMFSHTFNTKAPSSLSINNGVKNNQKNKRSKQRTKKNKK